MFASCPARGPPTTDPASPNNPLRPPLQVETAEQCQLVASSRGETLVWLLWTTNDDKLTDPMVERDTLSELAIHSGKFLCYFFLQILPVRLSIQDLWVKCEDLFEDKNTFVLNKTHYSMNINSARFIQWSSGSKTCFKQCFFKTVCVVCT